MDNIKELIALGHTEEALKILLSLSKIYGGDYYNKAILLSSKFQRIQRAEILGFQTPSEMHSLFQMLNLSILQLDEELNTNFNDDFINLIPQKPYDINISIISATGTEYNFKVSSHLTLKEFETFISKELRLAKTVHIGEKIATIQESENEYFGKSFYLRYVFVDIKAKRFWNNLARETQQKTNMIIQLKDKSIMCNSLFDRLYETGIYDFVKFQLYYIEDIGIPVGAWR